MIAWRRMLVATKVIEPKVAGFAPDDESVSSVLTGLGVAVTVVPAADVVLPCATSLTMIVPCIPSWQWSPTAFCENDQ